MFPIKDDIPSYSRPVVNYLLITINVIVFFYELSRPNLTLFLYRHSFIPALFFVRHDYIDSFVRAFNSLFIHGGFMHIIGNMWFLWIFGDNVEDKMGHVNYLIFYLIGGIVSMFAQGVVTPTSTVPLIGASGAISAVMGAYLMFFPQARILTLVPIFFFITFLRIPAWFFIVFWFFMQYLNGIFWMASASIGGVAWFAHIGGFIYGVILGRILYNRLNYRL